uniref:Uncharacterized protein n=1 Tax=Anguilla anguilla TaxID=7936 RepID=A0A0E9UR65_ANGAN
MCKLGVVL